VTAPSSASDNWWSCWINLKSRSGAQTSRPRADFFREVADALDKPECGRAFCVSLGEDYLPHTGLRPKSSCPTSWQQPPALDAGPERMPRGLSLSRPPARCERIEPSPGGCARWPDPDGRGTEGGGDLVQADGRVPPAALQLCSIGFTAMRCHRPQFRRPAPARPAPHTRGLQCYPSPGGQGEEAQEVQGARAILAGYVNESWRRLAQPQARGRCDAAGCRQGIGREILKVMVTSHTIKSVLMHEELLAGLCNAGVIRRDDAADANGSRTPSGAGARAAGA